MAKLDVVEDAIAQDMKMIDLFTVIKMNAKRGSIIWKAYVWVAIKALLDAKHAI